MWRTLRRRFIARDQYASEIKAELEFHVQMRADELQEGGLPRQEALRQARVELGNPETIRQDVRNAGFGAWIEPLFQDVRFGLRMLGKRPGVTLIGAASLAVGIGVCTFFFSQFNAMVLRPLPGARAPRELAATRESFSYPTFERFRELQEISEAAAYVGPVPFNVAFENGSGGARVFGHLVSPDYFSVLGVVPAAGRFFSPETERVGSEAVVVVSDPFWRRRLNADPEAVGGTLRGWPAGAAAGDRLAAASIELRLPVTPLLSEGQVGLRLFYDTAAAYDAGRPIRDARFRQGAGVGVFFQPPRFGLPVSVDVARDVDGGVRTHVSAGFGF